MWHTCLWTTLLVKALGQEGRLYNQDIDHFQSPGLDEVKVPQRYWVNRDHWDGQGPVFLYLCGETECSPAPRDYMYPLEVASKLHALFISVEHRYYGHSLPDFPGGRMEMLPSSLEVNQALADTVLLINHLKTELDLGSQKWLVVGGGYAGALAAWLRTRYPDLVSAAWASSATIQSIVDFDQFDEQVYFSALKSGQYCVDAIKEVNDMATEAFLQGFWGSLAGAFGAMEAFRKDIDKRTVLWFLADIIAKLVQNGHRTELCNCLSLGNPRQSLTSIANLAEVKSMQKYELARPLDYSSAANSKPTPKRNSRQFYWQMCAQFGWFQVASSHPMRSTLLDHSFWNNYCNTIFPYFGILVPEVPTTLSHLGSNILFTNGSEDPWQWASYLGQSLPAQQLLTLKIECDDCGHCVDQRTPSDKDPEALLDARNFIEETVKTWIEAI